MQHTAVSHKIVQKATLYRVVFDAVAVRYVVAFMFLFFVLHPAVPVFAGEEEMVGAQEESVVEPESEPEVTSEPVAETQEQETEEGMPDSDTEEVVMTESEEETSENTTSDEVETIEDGNTATTDDSSLEEKTPVDDVAVPVVPDSDTSSSSENEADTESTGTSAPQTNLEDLSKLLASSTPTGVNNTGDEDEDPVPEVAGVATSTDEAEGVPEEIVSVVEEPYESLNETTHEDVDVTTSTETDDSLDTVEGDSRADDELTTEVPEAEHVEVQNFVEHTDSAYQFQKTQCIAMGDGGFYCTNVQDATVRTPVNGVFAELDIEGDMEIFIQTDGKTKQITDNTFDDSAPSYDALSDTIVWHRLIEGRYQIISFSSGDETQITQSRNNSMEPHRSGEYTVWQEWIGDNWEVMLFDGGDILQITDTAEHEVAPYIQGGYVIWTVTNGANSSVSVYDIQTGLMSAIDDTEGGRVENPRFVLVYDTKFENGDVITKGFDPETGEVVPLSAQAGTVPVDIPSSDTTGETRALIQNKSSNSREDFTEEITGTTTARSAASATTTDDILDNQQTLDLSEGFAAEEATTTTSEILPLTDFDIIVEPFSASSSAQADGSASSSEAVE